MSYYVCFQTEEKYRNKSYGKNSIYNSACGCASLINALHKIGIKGITLEQMCAFSVSVGARVDGGTDMRTLLRAASSKYHFVYSTTSKNAELLAHLKSGGSAILHAGNEYKLFSNSGHFVCAVDAIGETITVLDSYWYSGKYTASSIRRNYVSVVEKGVVKTSLTQCGRATIDRSPSYYLISKENVQREDIKETIKEDTKMSNGEIKQLIRDVIAEYMEEISNKPVSDSLSGAWAKAQKDCLTDGRNPQMFATREQVGAMSERVLDVVDKTVNKTYVTVEDVPVWGRNTVYKLLMNGYLNGTGLDNTGKVTINITESMLRIFVILDRTGVFDK